MSRQLLIPAVLQMLGGCILGTGKCDYEIRSISFAASLTGVVHGFPDSGSATLRLGETKGDGNSRTMIVIVQTFLAGAVSDVKVLFLSGEEERVIATIEGYGGPDGWSGYLQFTSGEPTSQGLKLLDQLGGLDLVATIGTGSGGTLRGRLHLEEDTGWVRPSCD